jgi:hypothetical protein
MWVQFCFSHPLIGLPITAIVVFVFYRSHRAGLSAYQGSVIRRGDDAAQTNRTTEALSAAAGSDADFNVNQFAGRVQTAFMKIQNAWCAQDMNPVWPFISDGVHERFTLQLDEQKALGYQDRMEQIGVDSITLVEFTPGDVFDVATVRISAWAADYRVSLADGKRISGSTTPEPFVEMWSWIRRHGVKRDPSKPGLIEGNCPNCGAAIEMNQFGKCAHCGAILQSGEFDWVLIEITQQSEWRRGRYLAAIGAQDMRAADPGFSRVDVEDCASVMFWRKALADRVGKIDAVRKMATENFCAEYAKCLAPNLQDYPDGSRPFFGDCAVGAANLLGVVMGESEDVAVVEVAWEGERMIAPAGFPNSGKPLQRTGQRIQVHSLYLLKRKAGVKSDPGKGVTSAHCARCGAPFTSDTSPGCTYCGAVLNDGSLTWVVTEITSASSVDGQNWIRKLRGGQPPYAGVAASAPQPADHFTPSGMLAWATKIAAADGVVDDNERGVLRGLAERENIDPGRVDQLIDMAVNNRLDVADPPDKMTAHRWLMAMAFAASANGRVPAAEAQLLVLAAQRFGFSAADVEMILKQQYAQRLAGARGELRAVKRG